MKKIFKIIIHFIAALLGSLLFGLLGLVAGANIGGNYPVPKMFGLAGYEASGVAGGLLGISFGSLVVTVLLWRWWKEGDIITSLSLLLLATILNLMVYKYISTVLVYLLIPPVLTVMGLHIKSIKHLFKN